MSLRLGCSTLTHASHLVQGALLDSGGRHSSCNINSQRPHYTPPAQVPPLHWLLTYAKHSCGERRGIHTPEYLSFQGGSQCRGGKMCQAEKGKQVNLASLSPVRVPCSN